MWHHGHSHSVAPETRGHTIRWGRVYDPFVKLWTVGQAPKMRQRTVALAQLQVGERVLDVGCGTGELTLCAKEAVGATGYVCGTDAAPEMIEVACRKVKEKGLEVDFQVDLIEKISFPDASFDVVLSSLMMHHLPPDVKRAGLAEIYRVLKPGGRVVVVDFKHPTSKMGRLLMMPLLHHALTHGIQSLPPLMEEARLTKVDTGDLAFWVLGFARAQKA
ncbi:MAG: class I SAM-dependent methyltransferase [Ardenticatenaceae bacterium]